MEEPTLDQIERGDPLVDNVLQKITEAFVTNRLKPGDKLTETQLAEQLGVSRGPVREAIRRLEQMGLVEKIPYRGAFISQLTEHDIIELYSVREPLEGLAARILSQRNHLEAVTELEKLLTEMEQAAAAGDRGKIVILDADFHDMLVSLCEHKLLNEIWQPVSIRMRRFLLLKNKHRYDDDLNLAVRLHQPIVEAIASGNTLQAEETAREHVLGAIRYLNHQLSFELEIFGMNGRVR